MAPSSDSKPVISIRVPPGQVNALNNALNRLEAQYGALLKAWPQLTREQRERVLAHSPILRRLYDLTAPLREEVR